MKTNKTYLYFLICVMFTSCQTYQTFYKETATLNSLTQEHDQRLDVSNSKPVNIENKITKFTNLRYLNLSNSPNLNLENILTLIPNPLKLRVLIMDGNNLKKLPINIKRFVNLKQISLNRNPYLDLNHTFNILSNLPIIFLNLQDNLLNKLPANIAKLKKLEDFNLTGNSIKHNQTFTYLNKLPNLKSLWLNRNKLKKLPKGLFTLEKIKNLYLEHNQLKSISLEISKLKNVWIIHAGHNNFTELPKAFATVPKLLLLHINNCKISSIPEIYATKTSHIMGLILDNNYLHLTTKRRWKKIFRSNFLLSME